VYQPCAAEPVPNVGDVPVDESVGVNEFRIDATGRQLDPFHRCILPVSVSVMTMPVGGLAGRVPDVQTMTVCFIR
jgi:hypothetical protein